MIKLPYRKFTAPNQNRLNQLLLQICDGDYTSVDSSLSQAILKEIRSLRISRKQSNSIYQQACISYCLAHGCNVDAQDLQTGESPLIKLAKQGNEACVKLLIEHKADVDHSDYEGITALHVAARIGHVGIASLLVEGECNVFAQCLKGNFALHLAVRSLDVIKLLLSAGTPVNAMNQAKQTPLHMAVLLASPLTCLEHLVSKGADYTLADIHQETPLAAAIRLNGTQAKVDYLLELINVFNSESESHCLKARLQILLGQHDPQSTLFQANLPKEMCRMILEKVDRDSFENQTKTEIIFSKEEGRIAQSKPVEEASTTLNELQKLSI